MINLNTSYEFSTAYTRNGIMRDLYMSEGYSKMHQLGKEVLYKTCDIYNGIERFTDPIKRALYNDLREKLDDF